MNPARVVASRRTRLAPVDILLLFVRGKAVHFPRIKSAFTRACQDVFGAYLQTPVREREQGPALRSKGGKGVSGGAGALCPKRFFFSPFFPPSSSLPLTEGENWLKGCQRKRKHTSRHAHVPAAAAATAAAAASVPFHSQLRALKQTRVFEMNLDL